MWTLTRCTCSRPCACSSAYPRRSVWPQALSPSWLGVPCGPGASQTKRGKCLGACNLRMPVPVSVIPELHAKEGKRRLQILSLYFQHFQFKTQRTEGSWCQARSHSGGEKSMSFLHPQSFPGEPGGRSVCRLQGATQTHLCARP